MRNVEFNTKEGPQCHPIYDKAEADELKIAYKGYTGDLDEGDWILTDDAKVVKVLKIGRWPNGRRWIRTCTGTFPVDQTGARVDTQPRQCRLSIGGKLRDPYTQPLNDRLREWARLVALGRNRIDAYKQVFPTANSEAYIDTRTRALVKREDIRKVMAEELKDTLEALGIDNKRLLEGFLEIFDGGERDADRIAAGKILANVIGLLDGKKEKTTVNTFLGISSTELQKLEAGEAPTPIAGEVVDAPDNGEVSSAEDQLMG